MIACAAVGTLGPDPNHLTGRLEINLVIRMDIVRIQNFLGQD